MTFCIKIAPLTLAKPRKRAEISVALLDEW